MRHGLLILFLFGCVSGEAVAQRGLLGTCTFNDECQSPLICAARRCRAECRTDRDCTNGWRCRSAGQGNKFVCYDPADRTTACEYSSHCQAPDICGPGNVCQSQCSDDYDCIIRRSGTFCIVTSPGMGLCSDHPNVDGGVQDVPNTSSQGDGG